MVAKEMNGAREGEMCNLYEPFSSMFTEQRKVDVYYVSLASLDDSVQSRNTEVSVIEEARIKLPVLNYPYSRISMISLFPPRLLA
jgi:hypothetical protein